jgi:Ni,Fe-hydrogenase III small subunit/formate hydrogenlyase subunit 6/NADH:ubiquinone oxidoreductase subunit I
MRETTYEREERAMGMIGKILQHGRVTLAYPKRPMDSSRFAASPAIDASACNLCGACVARCPSGAIAIDPVRGIGINYDECVFCALCADVCPTGAARMTPHFELARRNRADLRISPIVIREEALPAESIETTGHLLAKEIHRRFGRSLAIREVDSGSCNACDYEINGLNNPFNDIERFGVHFVASPRHADLLLVTGTAVRNMELALLKTYNATPDPELVVAVGACACSGGIFRDSYATRDGIDGLVPVDVYVPGCPPRPQAILHGILLAIGRMEEKGRGGAAW